MTLALHSILRPSLRETVRDVLRISAQHEAAECAPRVEWRGLDEGDDAFARRLALRRASLPAQALVLGVSPPSAVNVQGVRVVELPAKLFRVFHPGRQARYRVAHGGRGSAKSWTIARALVLLALVHPLRIGCFREIQKSIADSVHRLLNDQIDAIGVSRWFTVLQNGITSHCGAEFMFEGLRANVTKIKSLEGVDIAWVEEAAKVSAYSWQVLIPTVRRPHSQIWVNFNPEDEDDPTYARFVAAPPPGAIVERVLYTDNPWFPAELEAERTYLERVDADAHAHVWLGECRKASDAQVFRGKYRVEAFTPAADWSGPYHGADWGFASDPTALVKLWVHANTLYVEHEAYGVGVDIDRTSALFDRVPGAAGAIIRADNSRPETISYMRRHGYANVMAVDKWSGSVEDGIAFLRQFEAIVVHPRCTHVIDEMRLYTYKVDALTGDVLPELVDAHNHCVDAMRYALAPLIRRAGDGLLEFYKQRLAATGDPHPCAHGQGESVKTDLVTSPWHR